MTLEIQAGARPPLTGAVVPAQTRAPVASSATASRQLAIAETADPDALDTIAKRLYISAGIGAAIAAAAATALYALGWPMHTVPGKMLGALLVLGVTMFTGGATTGSLRPHGGHR